MDRTRITVFLLGTLAVVFLSFPATAVANSSPVVTNVVAQQISGTGQVRVTYDVSDVDGDQLAASLVCSSDNGASFALYPVTVSGDIHTPMAAGTGKQITWNAAADYPGRFWSQVVAKVVVSDGPSVAGLMVLIPSGAFTMGATDSPDQQPVHTVILESYYIDKFEVTNAEFEAFINAGGYSTQAFWSQAGWSWRSSYNITAPAYWLTGSNNSGPSWPGFPVVGVSWHEAVAYARFAAKRLPTEAEWEKAARGTDSRPYPWGTGFDGSRANFYLSGDPYESSSTPVGFYDGRLHPSPAFQTADSPGPYGAYDQAGNVQEWVQDWYDQNYYAASPGSNPPGPVQGSVKVNRGGNGIQTYQDGGNSLRTHYRFGNSITFREAHLGFRCARTP